MTSTKKQTFIYSIVLFCHTKTVL